MKEEKKNMTSFFIYFLIQAKWRGEATKFRYKHSIIFFFFLGGYHDITMPWRCSNILYTFLKSNCSQCWILVSSISVTSDVPYFKKERFFFFF